MKNRLEDARKLNDEILKASPQDNEALIYRGQIQLRDGHLDEAITSLQAALKSDPNNGVAHYHLGMAFDQQGNLARAETEWRDAVRLHPELMEAQRALAAVSIRKADWSSLNQIASTIIKSQPMAPDGYALRAIAEINQKDISRAEQDINKTIEVAPQNATGYVQMGNLRQLQRQYGEAEKFYQKGLDVDPSNSDALNGLMTVYLNQKEVDKAIAAANAQIAKVPNSSAFHDLLGTALSNYKKDYKGAETELRKAADLDKKNSDALLKLGQVLNAQGSVDQAIATYQQSAKENPNEISFYILLGELYESQKKFDDAKNMYQKALQIQHDNPAASNNLAYVMLQTGGNVDVAISLAQTARRQMPDNPNAADTLGWAYYQKGLYPTAIDLFKEAVKQSSQQRNDSLSPRTGVPEIRSALTRQGTLATGTQAESELSGSRRSEESASATSQLVQVARHLASSPRALSRGRRAKKEAFQNSCRSLPRFLSHAPFGVRNSRHAIKPLVDRIAPHNRLPRLVFQPCQHVRIALSIHVAFKQFPLRNILRRARCPLIVRIVDVLNYRLSGM